MVCLWLACQVLATCASRHCCKRGYMSCAWWLPWWVLVAATCSMPCCCAGKLLCWSVGAGSRHTQHACSCPTTLLCPLLSSSTHACPACLACFGRHWQPPHAASPALGQHSCSVPSACHSVYIDRLLADALTSPCDIQQQTKPLCANAWPGRGWQLLDAASPALLDFVLCPPAREPCHPLQRQQ